MILGCKSDGTSEGLIYDLVVTGTVAELINDLSPQIHQLIAKRLLLLGC